MGKSYNWEPPHIGAKRENEIEMYSFAVPAKYGMPFSKDSKKFIEAIKKIEEDGTFIALYPNIPYGINVICKTLNDAKGCRNMLKLWGIKCGENIATCFVDKKYVNGET